MLLYLSIWLCVVGLHGVLCGDSSAKASFKLNQVKLGGNKQGGKIKYDAISDVTLYDKGDLQGEMTVDAVSIPRKRSIRFDETNADIMQLKTKILSSEIESNRFDEFYDAPVQHPSNPFEGMQERFATFTFPAKDVQSSFVSSDGIEHVVLKDGTKIQAYSGGIQRIFSGDGSMQVKFPDTSYFTYDADGNIEIYSPSRNETMKLDGARYADQARKCVSQSSVVTLIKQIKQDMNVSTNVTPEATRTMVQSAKSWLGSFSITSFRSWLADSLQMIMRLQKKLSVTDVSKSIEQNESKLKQLQNSLKLAKNNKKSQSAVASLNKQIMKLSNTIADQNNQL